MSRKLVLVLLTLALFVAPLHAASKRRIGGNIQAGGPPPPPPPPPGPDCATYKPVRVGLKASYLTTSPSGNVTYTVTYVSDSGAQTVTTQKVTAAGVTTDVETHLDFDTVPNVSFDLRALRHLNVKSTSAPIPGFNVVT
ncbi:MAG TPA: hypothetical protein VN181_14135, partial [Thermoanaerobaculia bacterium]|nr:hypothetical protein [Thermoanaerobaculia bacterium]